MTEKTTNGTSKRTTTRRRTTRRQPHAAGHHRLQPGDRRGLHRPGGSGSTTVP